MDRIFHARIAFYQYLLLIVFAATAFIFLWFKYSLAAILLVFLLIFIIEKIIHTTYTVTKDNKLVVYRGRFARKIIIPLADVTALRRGNSMKFGRFSVTSYILVEYGENRFVSVMPIKEDEFVKLIDKRLNPISSAEQ